MKLKTLALTITGILMTSVNLMAQNETLSERQQGIVAIAANEARGDLAGLASSIEYGLDNGLTVNQVKEILSHLYAYTGFPRSLNGLGTLQKVLDQRTADGKQTEIGPEAEYSAEDLDWTVETSRCCKENADPSSRPAFVKTKENLDAYDVVYLGFPNWWNGAPRIINTFIEAYGLKGKTVILFMTSGGSGIQNSLKVLGKQYPEVNFKTGKLLNGASRKTADNLSSLQIHHHLGFCQVSRFPKVGRKFGRWLDVIDLELIL